MEKLLLRGTQGQTAEEQPDPIALCSMNQLAITEGAYVLCRLRHYVSAMDAMVMRSDWLVQSLLTCMGATECCVIQHTLWHDMVQV